tara:strand:+ start:367 stop:678 length:312 start_codon:yes stop_codon:yes gene_type:complete
LKSSLNSRQFPYIYNNSFIIKNSKIVYKISASGPIGLGFVLSRKLGSAYKRNLFKRRMRFLYNSYLNNKKKKISMIIIPKTINLSWFDIQHSFELAVKKINDV